MPKFLTKCIFPRRLRKIMSLFYLFETCHPTKNFILHLLSRMGQLSSDRTCLKVTLDFKNDF